MGAIVQTSAEKTMIFIYLHCLNLSFSCRKKKMDSKITYLSWEAPGFSWTHSLCFMVKTFFFHGKIGIVHAKISICPGNISIFQGKIPRFHGFNSYFHGKIMENPIFQVKYPRSMRKFPPKISVITGLPARPLPSACVRALAWKW